MLLAAKPAAADPNCTGGNRSRWGRGLCFGWRCFRWRFLRGRSGCRALLDDIAIAVAIELLPVRTGLGDAPAIRFDLRLGAFKRTETRRLVANRTEELGRRIVGGPRQTGGFDEFHDRLFDCRRRPVIVQLAGITADPR